MKTILVTGANRSGTTWVGKMLSCSDRLLQVWEPFNYLMHPESKIAGASPFVRQYHYVLEQETARIKSYINRRIVSAAYMANKPSNSSFRQLLKLLGAVEQLVSLGINSKQVLLKDPIALLSAEWLAREYQAQVIVLIRHPAAYVNSIKRVNWKMSLECLLAQKQFMDTLPDALVAEISDRVSRQGADNGYNLEDAALSWKVFHQVIYQYQQTHGDWIFVRHEDLCHDFIHGFKKLYSQLALPWNLEVKDLIRQYCDNPSEKRPLGSEIHVLSRNSRSASEIWKQSLTPEEVNRIKEITQEVADLFYDRSSWI